MRTLHRMILGLIVFGSLTATGGVALAEGQLKRGAIEQLDEQSLLEQRGCCGYTTLMSAEAASPEKIRGFGKAS
ncbi:MAG: hypothetical protein ACFCUG_10275 [Thiotrichales bacterium]